MGLEWMWNKDNEVNSDVFRSCKRALEGADGVSGPGLVGAYTYHQDCLCSSTFRKTLRWGRLDVLEDLFL